MFVEHPLAEAVCRAAHTLYTSPGTGSDPCPGSELPPELAVSSQTLPLGMEQPQLLCLEQGAQGFCAQHPIPPSGKEDSPTTHSQLVFSLFPSSWQQAGELFLDMFGSGSSCSSWTESPLPSAPPGAVDGRSWAGAGAPQGVS